MQFEYREGSGGRVLHDFNKELSTKFKLRRRPTVEYPSCRDLKRSSNYGEPCERRRRYGRHPTWSVEGLERTQQGSCRVSEQSAGVRPPSPLPRSVTSCSTLQPQPPLPDIVLLGLRTLRPAILRNIALPSPPPGAVLRQHYRLTAEASNSSPAAPPPLASIEGAVPSFTTWTSAVCRSCMSAALSRSPWLHGRRAEPH